MTYYKITNVGDLPLAIPWNRGLLDPVDQEAYDAYKLTDEYLGVDPAQKAMFSRKFETERMEPFLTSLARGVKVKHYDPRGAGYGLGAPKPVYCWVIGADWEKLKLRPLAKSERNKGSISIHELCDRYYIPVTGKESKEELIEKLKAIIGSNVKVVNENVVHNLEEANQIRREIEQALQPGQATKKIVNEGNIAVEEVDGPIEEIATEAVNSAEGTSKGDLSGKTYRELQAMAKDRKLPYVGVSQAKLIESLLAG